MIEQSLHKTRTEIEELLALQFSIPKSTHESLRYAQDLLSHSIPDGDLAQLFDRALHVLISHVEKQRFASTSDDLEEVIAGLRSLGCKAREARRAAEITPRNAPIQERLLEALRFLSRRHATPGR